MEVVNFNMQWCRVSPLSISVLIIISSLNTKERSPQPAVRAFPVRLVPRHAGESGIVVPERASRRGIRRSEVSRYAVAAGQRHSGRPPQRAKSIGEVYDHCLPVLSHRMGSIEGEESRDFQPARSPPTWELRLGSGRAARERGDEEATTLISSRDAEARRGEVTMVELWARDFRGWGLAREAHWCEVAVTNAGDGLWIGDSAEEKAARRGEERISLESGWWMPHFEINSLGRLKFINRSFCGSLPLISNPTDARTTRTLESSEATWRG